MTQKWTQKLVAEAFEDAVQTLKKLPRVTVQGYLSSSYNIVHSVEEISEMKQQPMKILPSPSSISRADKVISWVKWVTEKERKLIWKRAARLSWKYICHDAGIARTTAWLRWKKALYKISAQLNKQGSPKDYWRGF